MSGFNGDTYICGEFARLVSRWSIKTIVETGTCHGATARLLAGMVPVVHTIELDPKWFLWSAHLDEFRGVTRHRGSSPDVLAKILPDLTRPVMFYLDAHWKAYWPLLDELRVIAEHSMDDAVIVIHDCKVPGRNFGYDVYDGQELCFDYVASSLQHIYGDNGFAYYFNDKATGARRGVLYVTPAKP